MHNQRESLRLQLVNIPHHRRLGIAGELQVFGSKLKLASDSLYFLRCHYYLTPTVEYAALLLKRMKINK